MDFIVCTLVFFNLCLGLMVLYRLDHKCSDESDSGLTRAEMDKLIDEAVEEAFAELEENPAEKDDDPTHKIDEGFENLMTYSVSLGRGKKTGGEP